MSSTTRHFYEFGPYRVDPAMCRLLRGDTHVPLPPKAFDLLLILVRNPNRVLSKAELMQALWPDTFVDEANLTQHVFTLRKTLGSQTGGAAYIETVPRRGYIFAAAVQESTDAVPHAESPPAVPLVVEGERKRATVLHCGVANASMLAERLGPAHFDSLMTELVGLVAEETGRYEGVFRRTRPDGFEAMFGARVLHEDDPWRAVLTALAVQRGVAALLPEPPPGDERPAVRIGIATGPVVVTRRVRDHDVDYSAVGETMRVADLLQQLAEPGTTLISHATRQAVEGYVALERTTLEVGGAVAFRITGAAPARLVRPPRLMRTLEPFVGRVHELGLLADLATRARAGRGQVAGVVGEPGIGKSRLLLEFTSTMPDLTVVESRCVSYGSLVPYLPLADLVRAYCGVKDGESVDEAFRAVRAAIATAALPGDAERWLLRLLGARDTAADKVSPEAIKARTFDVLRALLLHASTLRPVVIVIEDIHWIDRTSEEFLALIVERVVAARMLIIVTFRPGYHVPWRDRSHVTQLTLTALTAADSETLIGAIARETHIPPRVSAEILAKAEGNPFFLEELTRAVLEHGPADRVPDTVHGVVMARIDRLPDTAKQLLQTAAVLGREVSLRLLTRVWRGKRQIAPELEELCRFEFLFEKSGGDEQVFVFRHALTQDVAYDSLLARQRRDLHLETARALEELYSSRIDEMTATLAYHYARTDLTDEAVTWLMRAADRAARVYANAEAILHLDIARRRLERLPPDAERDRRTLDVALRHAHSLYFLGRFRESVDVLQPHAAPLARLDDPGLTAAYCFWLAHMYSRLGDQRRAADSAYRAIDAATSAGDRATLGKAHGLLALEGHWAGNAADGIAHGKEAIRLLRVCPDQQWWLGMAHFYVAMNHLHTGEFEAALAEAVNADTVGKEIGDPRLQTYAGFTAAWVEASRGNCGTAVALSRGSREQAPDRVSRAYASMILGYALLEAGDHRAARDQLEPIVTELESFGFPQWQAWASTLTGETHRLDGALTVAATFVERGLDVARQARYWYAVGFAERIAGRIARDRGYREESVAAFDRALQTFERIGARFEATRTHSEATGALGITGIAQQPEKR
jgi:DNA-binding winged helix-turn-helix (wHTH) protein/tetratricopeptide (TPR) repeat protein